MDIWGFMIDLLILEKEVKKSIGNIPNVCCSEINF